MGQLKGKCALVTGGARGLGFATAKAFNAEGAKVAVTDRREAEGARAAASLGDDVVFLAQDVTKPEEWDRVLDQVVARLGAIDILVNNAGIQRRAPLETFSADDWNDLLRVNLDGAFHVSQAVARHMLPRGRGKIINICSVQGELARPGIAPYAATKGAIRMLTKGMCAEWAGSGIQANALAPGYFATDLNRALVDDPDFSDWLCKRTPAGRWGRVEELCGAAVFLASSASDFVNGQTLFVDGGLTSVV
jgi:gluconate 5-dehydrogenase